MSTDEISAVQEGETVGKRGGIIPDSKVEIHLLSLIRPDNSNKDRWNGSRLDKATNTPLFVELLSNQDLRIIIPEIVLSDVRVTGRTIPRTEIIAAGGNIGLRNTVPEDGVRINFGGSLKIIDVYSFTYDK